jgi:hypothetical protein
MFYNLEWREYLLQLPVRVFMYLTLSGPYVSQAIRVPSICTPIARVLQHSPIWYLSLRFFFSLSPPYSRRRHHGWPAAAHSLLRRRALPPSPSLLLGGAGCAPSLCARLSSCRHAVGARPHGRRRASTARAAAGSGRPSARPTRTDRSSAHPTRVGRSSAHPTRAGRSSARAPGGFVPDAIVLP